MNTAKNEKTQSKKKKDEKHCCWFLSYLLIGGRLTMRIRGSLIP